MDVLGLLRAHARDDDCPRCGKALAGCRLRLLGRDDRGCTVQMTCAACGVSFVVAVQLGGVAPTASTRAVIGADEILTLHELLSAHRGALTELLRPGSRPG